MVSVSGNPPPISPSRPRRARRSACRISGGRRKSSCFLPHGQLTRSAPPKPVRSGTATRRSGDAGAEVIGISADSEGSHRRFADRLPPAVPSPQRLLRGGAGAVRRPEDVRAGPGPGWTYLIDREGIVRASSPRSSSPPGTSPRRFPPPSALRRLREAGVTPPRLPDGRSALRIRSFPASGVGRIILCRAGLDHRPAAALAAAAFFSTSARRGTPDVGEGRIEAQGLGLVGDRAVDLAAGFVDYGAEAVDRGLSGACRTAASASAIAAPRSPFRNRTRPRPSRLGQ